MPLKIGLGQIALEVANNIQERAFALKPELEQVKFRQKQIEMQINEAHLCLQRVARFQPMLGGDLQCPRCWVANEKSFPLKPISSDNSSDNFRCTNCQFDFSIDH